MILKTEEEVKLLRRSNQLVAKTLAEVAKMIKPGVTTLELDKVAETFIRDHDALPGFLGYHGFPNTLCTSVNSQVVHGIPSNTPLKEGDIVSVDCGVILNGYYGDSAYTFPIGKVSEATMALLINTKEALYKGIAQAVTGNKLGDISYTIQQHAEQHGYSVVRELVGHGLGKNMHEPPEVPNYGRKGSGVKLKKGLVICIEPMINMGVKSIVQKADGWTVQTKDNKPSAHYEHAVAIDNGKADILSSFEYIEEELKKYTEYESLLKINLQE